MRPVTTCQNPEKLSLAVTPWSIVRLSVWAGLLLIATACSTTTTNNPANGAVGVDTNDADAGATDAGATDTAANTADSAATDTGTAGAWIDAGGVVSENTNVLCGDGEDNDNDGKTDCDDLSCAKGIGVTVCDPIQTDKENTDATCQDGKDNDSDGKTDCDDTDCKESTLVTVCDATSSGKEDNDVACSDGKDNDNNGYTDCKDFGCSKNPQVTVCDATSSGKEDNDVACSDGKDNDNNGYTDCKDFGCSKNPSVTVCGGGKAVCGNGKCESGETKSSCAKDCTTSSATSCVGNCGGYDDKATCQCDDFCSSAGDCCSDYKATCSGTKPVCGNGKCEAGETKTSCAKDCSSVVPKGSCKGKCGDYNAAASCQCDSGCAAAGDCCGDLKALCGDVTQPSTSCLAAPWHQQPSVVAPLPRVAADGKAVWLAAGKLMHAPEPGATLSALPWAVTACVAAACTNQVVVAQGVVADPAGGVVAVGLFAAVTGATWNQGVVARYDAAGKAVWSRNLLGAGTAKTAELSAFGAVTEGPTGKVMVAAAMKEAGGAIARVWAVGAAGAVTETTWTLAAGVAEVYGVAWTKDNLRVAGVAAGGGWLGGVTAGKSWQVALAGVNRAADVALTDKGDCYVVGHTTVSAGIDSWLGRFDNTGKQLWISKLGGGVQDRFDRVIALQQGAVLAGATIAKGGKWRAWLVATDGKGIVQAQNTYGLPGLDTYATGAAMPDPEGVLLVARLGAESKPTGVWLVRTDGNGLAPCSDAKGATCGAATVPCDDGQACTIDACDAKTGTCTHAAGGASAPCQDGNLCTGAGVCKAGACTAGAAVADGQSCGGSGTCKVGVCVGDKAVTAKVGDLVFSELMIRSKSGNGDDGEWIELTNVSTATIDLEGLSLVYKGGLSVKLTGKGKPLVVKPGARFVIGRSASASKNYGAAIDYVQTMIAMSNSGATLDLKLGKVVIDAVQYTKPDVTLGAAWQLSADKTDAKSNDDAKAWCLGTQVYGTAGMKGTPGAANAVCK